MHLHCPFAETEILNLNEKSSFKTVTHPGGVARSKFDKKYRMMKLVAGFEEEKREEFEIIGLVGASQTDSSK